MTVLPATSGWFSPDAEVMVNGTAHRLLLRAEHTINVRSVHNLLRETYHSVALLDADARRRRCIPLRLGLQHAHRAATVAILPTSRVPPPSLWQQPLHEDHHQQLQQQQHQQHASQSAMPPLRPPANSWPSGMRASANVLAVLSRASTLSSAARMASAAQRASSRGGGALPMWRRAHGGALRRFVPRARVPRWWSCAAPHDAQLHPSTTRLSTATVLNTMHADRLRSADGVASHELTAELLARTIEEAHVRQTVLMLRVAAVAACLCAGALAVFLIVLAPTDVGRRDATAQPAERVEQRTIARPALADAAMLAHARSMVVTFGIGGMGNLLLLCLHPSAQERARIIAVGLFGFAVFATASVPWLVTAVRLAPQLAAGSTVRAAREASVLAEVLAAVLQVMAAIVCVGRGLTLLWWHRADAHRLLDTLWSSVQIGYVGTGAARLVEFVGRAAGGELSSSGNGVDAVATFIAVVPVAANALFAAFAALPRLQRRAQAMIARPGGGMQSVVASLAPLIGYGSIEGERNTVDLQAEALGALRGMLLDSTGLDALGAAWALVEAQFTPGAQLAGARGRTSAASRLLRAARTLATSVPGRSPADQSRGSTVPCASERARGPWVEDCAAVGGVAWRGPAPPAPPVAQHVALSEADRARQLDALARAHTAVVTTYDCYIVHDSCSGDARIKVSALRRFARQFERIRGRPPVAFVATLCDRLSAQEPGVRATAMSSGSDWPNVAQPAPPPDEARSSGNGATHHAWLAALQAWCSARSSQPSALASAPLRVSNAVRTPSGRPGVTPRAPGHAAAFRPLEHLPVRMARSSQLLVLASAPLFEQLWPTMEVFVWRLTGGGQDMVRVLPVVADEHEGSALLTAIDAFHVMYCREPQTASERRVVRLVEMAGMSDFNETVRALYPAVRDELMRSERVPSTGRDNDFHDG